MQNEFGYLLSKYVQMNNLELEGLEMYSENTEAEFQYHIIFMHVFYSRRRSHTT
jgi:hypothetical protein